MKKTSLTITLNMCKHPYYDIGQPIEIVAIPAGLEPATC